MPNQSINPITVVTDLIELARRINSAIDDSEEFEGPDGRTHAIAAQDFDDICDAIHWLEALPIENPEETLSPAGKAEWALRDLIHAPLGAPCSQAAATDELAELSLLNRLIDLGAKAAGFHAMSNSDDGHKGTAAYVQWQETCAQMGELIRSHCAATPQPPAAAPAPGLPSDAMVDAYLQAQRRAVEEADQFGRPNIGGLHTNTVREACRDGLKAALAAAPQPPAAAQEPEGGPPGSGGWKAHSEVMERERDHYRQRAQTMYEHQQGRVWYWQGDGGDHPESLCNSLPVVIRADQLRGLLSQPAAIAVDELAWLVVQEACETEPADEDDPECIRILRRDLKSAVLAVFLRHEIALAAKRGGA